MNNRSPDIAKTCAMVMRWHYKKDAKAYINVPMKLYIDAKELYKCTKR
jgi:hypothetical protein